MKIAFDIKLMRPACVLLQAALNADPSAAQAFDSDDWLLAPTPDLCVYEITKEQLVILVRRVKESKCATANNTTTET